MGGGGSGGGTTQQSSQYQSIAPWAQPYVTSILGAAQNQVFNTTQTPGTAGTPDIPAQYDSEGNLVPGTGAGTGTPGTPSSTQITGINPYTAYGLNGAGQSPEQLAAAQSSVAGFNPMQQQAFTGAANLQLPGQYGQASNMAGQAGMGALGTVGQAGMYGNLGAQAGQQYAGQSSAYGNAGAMQGQQGAAIGQSLGQQSQNTSQGPGSVASYMNPYLQNSLNPQLQLANQQYGITGQQQQGAATSAGAFGGSRSALANSLNQQNQMLAQNQIIGQGYNQAYNNAQNQMNAANQAALAGNQQALSGYGMGLQGAGQAGSQAMQGYGLGLQGIGAQQAGYGLAGNQATNLANIGGQQLQAQQGILGLQQQYGTQQQQQQQNIINQGMQNYATAQQYPMTQLGQLRNLISGLPMTDTTASQQTAGPSGASQLAGLGTAGVAGLGLYNTMNKP